MMEDAKEVVDHETQGMSNVQRHLFRGSRRGRERGR